MGKIKHIIIREYTTRVRKRAFIIMTILGPLLFAALMIVPIWVMQVEDSDEKKIAIIEIDKDGNPVPDSLMIFKGVIKDKPPVTFNYLGGLTTNQANALLENTDFFGLIILRHGVILSGEKVPVEFLAKKQPSSGIEYHISQALESRIHDMKLESYKISPSVIESLKCEVYLDFSKVNKDGIEKQGHMDVKRGIGYASSILIYFFIFLFGAQIMRGVVEEKTNRIVEVIITSVKPFQLMLGKIVGIGLVGLTQFLVWLILSTMIFQVAQTYFISDSLKNKMNEQPSQELFQSPGTTQVIQETPSKEAEIPDVLTMFNDIPAGKIIFAFIFFFIGGYLLYGSMFAAIGSAVDSETDVQQFMLPITIPMIIAIIVMNNVIMNPEGQIAFWFSMIPFTSPVIMMARMPFGVPPHELIISGLLLIGTFILMTWLSGKIYRTGILMYGKKTGYKEMMKWLRYK